VCESLSIEGGEKENYFCFIIITSSLGMKTEKNFVSSSSSSPLFEKRRNFGYHYQLMKGTAILDFSF